MRRLLAALGRWLNAKLGLMASDEDSAVYDAIDQELTRRGR